MRRVSPVLVGRETFVEVLVSAAARAAQGEGGALALVAPAGVGKSTLVRRFAQRVDPATVVIGRAAPPPATAMRALAEAAARAIDAGASPADVSETIYGNALQSLLGTSPPSREAGAPGALMTGSAMSRLLLTCPVQPAVLVVEDLHWADPETLSALDHLIDTVSDRSILVVATMRPAESPLAAAALTRWVERRVIDRHDLPLLDQGQVRLLIEACIDAEAPEQFVDQACIASDGNPFLVEEFLHAAIERGDLAERSDEWSYQGGSLIHVPETFQEAVGRRLMALPVEVRTAIQLCSLAGRDIDLEMMERLGLDHSRTVRAVTEALAIQLVDETAGTGSDYRFRHVLTQEAVAKTMSESERASLAASALDALESTELDDRGLEVAASLARHSGDSRRSCALFIEAATRAVRMGATDAALTFLDTAEDLADADLLHGAVIRECRLEALALAGRSGDALRLGEQLVVDLTASNDRTRLHRVQLALARASGANGDWLDAADRLDSTWPNLDGAPAEGLSFRAVTAIELGEAEQAARIARRVLGLTTRAGVAQCEAHEVLGRVARLESYSEAAVHFKRGVESAVVADLALWRARSLLELGLSEATLYGRPDSFEESFRVARESGALALTAMVGYNLSNLRGGFVFDLEQARAVAEDSIEAAVAVGVGKLEALAWLALGQAHGTGGKRAASLLAADKARQAAPDDPEIAALAHGMNIGWSALISESGSAAWSHYRDSLEILLSQPLQTATPPWYWGTILAVTHDPDGLGAEAWDVIRSPAMQAVPYLRFVDATCEAIQAGRRNEPEVASAAMATADAHIREHPELFERSPALLAVMTRLRAEAASRDGWGEPIEWLESARQDLEADGLVAAARSCSQLLHSAGAAPRRRGRAKREPPGDLAAMGVTAREAEVLFLLSARLTNREIAAELSISPKTVKSHVERLLAKTGRTNRVELGELATELGA